MGLLVIMVSLNGFVLAEEPIESKIDVAGEL